MERETNIDLDIYIKEFEKQKDQARKRFNETYTGDEQDSTYYWENLSLDYSEEIVDGNILKVSGTMKDSNGKELGFVHINVPLDFDKLIDIFQSYIKKLNKVKTVMESVKDE
jgi:predicted transcriptional regulator YheO